VSTTPEAHAAWREVARVGFPKADLGYVPSCLGTSHDLEADAVVGTDITSPLSLLRVTDRA